MLNKINKRRGGFTLVEIMIVVAIIALLAAIAVPGFLRARKRSQASRILNDLRLIDSAVDQYAIETNKASGATVGPLRRGGYAAYANDHRPGAAHARRTRRTPSRLERSRRRQAPPLPRILKIENRN